MAPLAKSKKKVVTEASADLEHIPEELEGEQSEESGSEIEVDEDVDDWEDDSQVGSSAEENELNDSDFESEGDDELDEDELDSADEVEEDEDDEDDEPTEEEVANARKLADQMVKGVTKLPSAKQANELAEMAATALAKGSLVLADALAERAEEIEKLAKQEKANKKNRKDEDKNAASTDDKKTETVEEEKKEDGEGSTDAQEDDDDSDAVSLGSYASDDSEDEEARNRIGDVPISWYDDLDHVGYDLDGKKVMKTLKKSEIDKLLEAADNPNAWRTIQDHKNQREVMLTKTDLEIISRLRQGKFPDKHFNAEPELPEFENKDSIHPYIDNKNILHNVPNILYRGTPKKALFVPSKWENMRVKKYVRMIRMGIIKPPPPPKPEVFDAWTDENASTLKAKRYQVRPLPAPKMPLPGHSESYNPPKEYLFTQEEEEKWEKTYEQDRPTNFVPQAFPCLRRVPAYKNFIRERFERCLDLYLVPRQMKSKMNVDPESLLPQLPSAKDLRPFPTTVSMTFDGHTQRVRALDCDRTGQWLATGSDDKTLRIWEANCGRCYKKIEFDGIVTSVKWSPVYMMLAVSVEETVYLIDPKLPVPDYDEDSEDKKKQLAPVEDLLKIDKVDTAEDTVKHVNWRQVEEDSVLGKQGVRISLKHQAVVKTLAWHAKGHYLAGTDHTSQKPNYKEQTMKIFETAVAPSTTTPNGQCLIHSIAMQKSMKPFKALKGLLQAVQFHPSKPILFLASQKNVRVFDLKEQKMIKQLVSGAKWISSMSVHRSGEHLLVGTYDRRLLWFDLELGNKPFKTLRYHDRAIRDVHFHDKFPLMASASDDCTTHCLHAKVFDDFVTNPLIVPVKKLSNFHKKSEDIGVMACHWHPTQPWLFTTGADGQVALWA